MDAIAWRYPPTIIEEALEECLPKADSQDKGNAALRLHTAMRYAVLGGGKRLRSQLLLESAGLVGGPEYSHRNALPAACALEFIHAYSLVHDDLPAMDDADTRRGQPSCHRQFDEATAILVGDGLLTLAFEVMARDVEETTDESNAVRDLKAIALIARAAGEAGMVGGQAIDISWSHGNIAPITPDELTRMHAMKTGALIRAAAEAGALLGGGTTEQIAALRDYGRHLGRAFQIHDDLLDIEGDPQMTGKSSSDVANSKVTAPAVLGIEEARHAAQQSSEDAVNALAIFGEDAETLRQLARFVVQREK